MTQKILNQNDYLKSSDLALCATLCCYGYRIEAINKQNPQKAIFLIKRDEQLDDLIQKYWTHQLKVEPMGFFNFLKEIKARIYSKE
jgi:hypothetical protein